MALPGILLRSPYFVNLESATLTSIRVDLYIYTGTLYTDKPVNPNYTLTASAFINSNGLNFSEIDIAPYCRDYVDVSFDFQQDNPSNAVWIQYDLYYTATTTRDLILEGSYAFVGLDGYNYPHQGYNKLLPEQVLMSGDTIEVPTGSNTTIPVLQDYVTGYKLYEEAVLSGGETPIVTQSLSLSSTESDDAVYYIDTTTGLGTPRTVVVEFSGGRPDQTIKIKYNNQCRNENIEISFINRYGVIQRAWLFGKSKKAISTTKTMYKKNLLDGMGGYDILKHQNDILTKNGVQTMTANTGFYKESSNYIWKEMLLSEKVWYNTDGISELSTVFDPVNITAPVTVKSSSIEYKTSLDDKLINYTFTFEYAMDVINSIR
tara:strand:- start:284 stop:1408 length:1125 start_codon:yes stop_codon:yes gene_type:complete